MIYDAPTGPSFRPNNPAQKDPINGKKINNKYIKDFQIINLKTLKKYKLNAITSKVIKDVFVLYHKHSISK